MALSARAADPIAAPTDRQIRITTANSAMTLVVGNDGRLYELGFGDVNRTNSAPAQGLPREMEFQPPAGNGFICEPAVQVTHADGNTSTDLIYVKHERRRWTRTAASPGSN